VVHIGCLGALAGPARPKLAEWGVPANDQPTTQAPRKRLRTGVIVRLLIYVPLLGFFGWQAVQRFQDGRRAADDNFRASVEQWLQHPPRTIVMPNGEVMPVLELTEEEAAQMGLIPEPTPEPTPQPTP
jgi:hypothetical protein